MSDSTSSADGSTQNELSSLKKLLPFLKNQKLNLFVLILSMLTVAAISVSIGLGVQKVVDTIWADWIQAPAFLEKATIIALIAVSIFGLATFTRGYFMARLVTAISQNIRNKVFGNLIKQDIKYFDHHSSGDLQTRIIADTDAIANFLSIQIPTLVISLITIIGGIVGAFYASTKLAWIVLIAVPCMFLPFVFVSRKLRSLGENVQYTLSKTGTFAGESFRSIKIVKAFNKEDQESKRFSGHTADLVKVSLKAARLHSGIAALVNTLAFSGFVFLLWRSAGYIFNGSLTIGQLVSFGYFAILIVQSTAGFVGMASSINVAAGTAKKIVEYLGLTVYEEENAVTKKIDTQGKVVFNKIHFSYPSRPDIEVLKGIDLSIDPGSQVAFVGPTGAGKSTIFDLILRFYEPNQGSIQIDGVDSNEIDPTQLRSIIGYVPQKESLISGSIFENISFGSDNADIEAVKVAAKQAYANDFIEELPDGYNTDLGEIGNRLSGGQKQRLSLARALVKSPRILLLDEAVSAQDAKSEKHLADAINNWSNLTNSTVITIAHRFSTILSADKIFVIDNGEIVGAGTHQQLLDTCSVYKNLLNASRMETEEFEDDVEVPTGMQEEDLVLENC